jgi:hypothetical protein
VTLRSFADAAVVAVTTVVPPAGGGNGPSDVDPATGKGPEWGKAAPIGLLVIVLMGVAVYFLIKSLNRNLKKVPESFQPAVQATAEGSDATGSAVVTPGDGDTARTRGADSSPPGTSPQ